MVRSLQGVWSRQVYLLFNKTILNMYIIYHIILYISLFIISFFLFIEIVKAGQQLLDKDSNIKMAKVHGPDNPGLLKKLNVTGYPTLFYYRNADESTLRTEEMYQPIKYEGNI